MSDELIKKQESPSDVAKIERTRDTVAYTSRFDIWEDDQELTLFGDLPGVDPKDLDIRFENSELSIHGKVAPRNAELQPLLSEYGIGDFYRSFAIGEKIDSAKISAELKNGVLTLHLPKTEAVKPRRIDVKAV